MRFSLSLRIAILVLGAAVAQLGAPRALAKPPLAEGASVSASSAPATPGVIASEAIAGKRPLFIDLGRFQAKLILAPPPPKDSPRMRAELLELHTIQDGRKPQDLARALADDHDESIFLFSDILGPKFNAAALPATAELGRIIRNDAGLVENAAKDYFARLRPYAVDPTLVGCPFAPTKPVNTSYPSGHAMSGFSYGVVLAAMMPDRAGQILARSRDYAEQRLVCGAHFRSDIEASAVLATSFARDLMGAQGFRAKMEASLDELRKAGIAK